MNEVMPPYSQGAPCWVELLAAEPELAVEFYQALFGWDYHPHGEPRSLIARSHGHPVAGIRQFTLAGGRAATWLTYLAVEKASATTRKVHDAGGTVLAVPTADPGLASRVVAQDSTGAPFGLWQSSGQIGVRPVATPGALCFSEVGSRDHVATGQFYQRVFGYESALVAPDGYEHTELRVAGQTVAAVYSVGEDLPAGIPPHWMPYFLVTDPDAVTAEALGRGARTLREPFDTPFGRMATIQDPRGAFFSLIAPESSK